MTEAMLILAGFAAGGAAGWFACWYRHKGLFNFWRACLNKRQRDLTTAEDRARKAADDLRPYTQKPSNR